MFYLPIMIAAVLISLLIIEGAFSGIYNSLLMAKEKIKKPAVVLAILTMLNILLNYIFIKIALPFGAIWALPAVASATFLSRYANLLALEKITRKTFNFSLPSKDIFFCFLASFVMLGFLLAFEYFFNPGIWLSLFMIVIAAGVYFAVLAAFYIHRT
jgi:O-antigen/teichoic acid export membrane protein